MSDLPGQRGRAVKSSANTQPAVGERREGRGGEEEEVREKKRGRERGKNSKGGCIP